ncbi:MAG: dTDP-4-dehydrorhamnose 3,5-epimerase [Oligoflexia bacterium]|nr:dTDP-4-dehydrorhamnose 3,5-epimerase [Oligoflexia bacterium]
MKITKTEIAGVFIIEPQLFWDDRGFFTEAWNKEIFNKNEIPADFVRSAISYNPKKWTLRGLHFQTGSHAEAKLIQVFKGRIFDAVVDIRKGSPTFGKYFCFELGEKDRKLIYVPRGMAHGFLTLEDETVVTYQLDNHYAPSAQSGIRFDDPAFKVPWPHTPANISEKDLQFADFKSS